MVLKKYVLPGLAIGIIALEIALFPARGVSDGQPVSVGSSGSAFGNSVAAPIVACTKSVAIDVNTTGENSLVAPPGAGQFIRVCGYNFISAGTVNVQLDYGTGATCGTGTTHITGLYNLTAQSGIAYGNGLGTVATVGTANNRLCISLSASSVEVSGLLTYDAY